MDLNLSSMGTQFLQTLAQHGPEFAKHLVAAAAIFAMGGWSARVAARILGKVLSRARLDETLAKFVCRLAHAMILVFVAVSGLDQLGINTTSLAAILAAAGLAVGMALQGSLSNFAAGVMMILFRPFKVGDMIEAGGARGIVEEIHIFNTLLRTGDNIQVIVPNSSITGSNITNYSTKPTRRIDLVIGCGYSDDIRAVKNFLKQLVEQDTRILRSPAASVAVSELAESSVNFVVQPWVAAGDYGAVRSDLIEKIKIGFDERGFQIPFPQRDVHVHAIAAAHVPLLDARQTAPVQADLSAAEPVKAAHSTSGVLGSFTSLVNVRRAA